VQLNCLFYLRKISSWQNNCKVEICPHFFTVDFFLKFQTINETKNCWNIFFSFSNRLIENAYIKAKTCCGPQTDPINVSKKKYFLFLSFLTCTLASSFLQITLYPDVEKNWNIFFIRLKNWHLFLSLFFNFLGANIIRCKV